MAPLYVLRAGPPFFQYPYLVGHLLKVLAGLTALLALGGLVAYFLSEPDEHSTEKQAKRFAAAAVPGASLVDAIQASPDFHSAIFGNCGHLDASPDSGPKGSLIFSPPTGAYARYTSFAEFASHNPKLLSEHEECRRITVEYMTQFPFRGRVEVYVDGKGVIRNAKGPVFFN